MKIIQDKQTRIALKNMSNSKRKSLGLKPKKGSHKVKINQAKGTFLASSKQIDNRKKTGNLSLYGNKGQFMFVALKPSTIKKLGL